MRKFDKQSPFLQKTVHKRHVFGAKKQTKIWCSCDVIHYRSMWTVFWVYWIY